MLLSDAFPNQFGDGIYAIGTLSQVVHFFFRHQRRSFGDLHNPLGSDMPGHGRDATRVDFRMSRALSSRVKVSPTRTPLWSFNGDGLKDPMNLYQEFQGRTPNSCTSEFGVRPGIPDEK